MKRTMPPDVRELWTVFEEFFTVRAAQYAKSHPNPPECLAMLQQTITVLRAYEESLHEMLDAARARARHDPLPKACPLRATRNGPII